MNNLNSSLKYHLIIGGLINLWIFVFIILIRSFDDVELVSVYPGSENLSATERKKCFKEHVAKLVENEFDFNITKNLKDLKSDKVDVFFMVDEKGKIKNRKIINTEIQIQAEIARILNQIPNMEPATHNGKEVGVIYTFPIVWGTGMTI